MGIQESKRKSHICDRRVTRVQSDQVAFWTHHRKKCFPDYSVQSETQHWSTCPTQDKRVADASRRRSQLTPTVFGFINDQAHFPETSPWRIQPAPARASSWRLRTRVQRYRCWAKPGCPVFAQGTFKQRQLTGVLSGSYHSVEGMHGDGTSSHRSVPTC